MIRGGNSVNRKCKAVYKIYFPAPLYNATSVIKILDRQRGWREMRGEKITEIGNQFLFSLSLSLCVEDCDIGNDQEDQQLYFSVNYFRLKRLVIEIKWTISIT